MEIATKNLPACYTKTFNKEHFACKNCGFRIGCRKGEKNPSTNFLTY